MPRVQGLGLGLGLELGLGLGVQGWPRLALPREVPHGHHVKGPLGLQGCCEEQWHARNMLAQDPHPLCERDTAMLCPALLSVHSLEAP